MEVSMEPRHTSRTGRRRLIVALATVVALSAAACAAAKPSGGSVDVALQEWAVLPAQSSVDSGPVTFTVENTGPNDEHEMVLIRTDLGAGALPTDENGKVDEEGAGMEAIGEIEEFAPGNTETATFDLEPGHYVLICNIVSDEPDGSKESHYKMGMFIDFTVN
jgi:uncharacterized cupredoxin-like copper-binding protein